MLQEFKRQGLQRGRMVSSEPRISLSEKGRILINRVLAEKLGIPCKVRIQFEDERNEMYFIKDATDGVLTINKNRANAGVLTSRLLMKWFKDFGIQGLEFKDWNEEKKTLTCTVKRDNGINNQTETKEVQTKKAVKKAVS